MNPPNPVVYLLGSQAVSAVPLAPYHPLACDLLNDLSSELRASKEATAYPDVMAFAFWCRKANITQLQSQFEDGRTRLGLGLALHITPSNVPINFAFSFAFGLLAGNANIVRVPTKPFRQIDIICTTLGRLFESPKYAELKAMTAFVRYERSERITAALSENCGARVIWGGDASIKDIRKSPAPVRCVEIAFSDRYSFCLLDAGAILSLDPDSLKRLAEGFYNDAYLMDQNACSSPHLIIWKGGSADAAQEKFWTAVAEVAAQKYDLSAVHAVDKYTLFCHDAIKGNNVKYTRRHGNYVYRVGLNKLTKDMDALRGTCGYFYECDVANENVLAPIVNGKYQTLTYFGIDKTALRDFVIRRRLSGIDRIVPVGKALDIGVIWDGYDVVKTLSRIIDVV